MVKILAIFYLFFLGNTGQENLFYYILEQKKSLCTILEQNVKKVEKVRFFNGFGQKLAIFPSFL